MKGNDELLDYDSFWEKLIDFYRNTQNWNTRMVNSCVTLSREIQSWLLKRNCCCQKELFADKENFLLPKRYLVAKIFISLAVGVDAAPVKSCVCWVNSGKWR